jgi:hypothetical protein
MPDSIMQIAQLADGTSTPFDGKYIVAYNASGPDSPGMRCLLEVTDDPALALRLPAAELLELWRSVDQRQPLRPDGQPNRPLTAFTVQTMRAP